MVRGHGHIRIRCECDWPIRAPPLPVFAVMGMVLLLQYLYYLIGVARHGLLYHRRKSSRRDLRAELGGEGHG